MKRNICILLVLTLSACLSSLYAQADQIILEYSQYKFNSIHMEAVGEIIFTQGDDCKVSIEGPEKYLSKMNVGVSNNTLTIDYKEKVNNAKKVKIYITAPRLSKIIFEGVGSFKNTNPLKFDDLQISMSGVGGINITNLTCKKFDFSLDGVGSAEVQVDCDEIHVDADGVGSVKLTGTAKKGAINKDGIGSMNTKNFKIGNK